MAIGDHVRTFAKLFTNLTPGQQREFERALADMDNSIQISSLETSLELLKRKPDQLLPIPNVTITPTVRGGIVEWVALPDQRINFYEVDVSDSSNFASFNTVTTFGIIAVLDGLTATRFIRVRGVRKDGTTTPYSEVKQLAPNLFDITVHTEEDFYIPVVGTSANTVLGGIGSNLDYTPINPNGNSMVWGFISIYGDPAVAMLGLNDIQVTVEVRVIDIDGSTVLSTSTPWQNTVGEFWSSMAIGPFTIAHPELNQSLEIRVDVIDGTLDGADNTEVFWVHLNALELGIS